MPTRKSNHDGNILTRRTFAMRGVVFYADQIMTIPEARKFLQAEHGSVKRTRVYIATAAVREKFDVEDEDDLDLADILAELQTEVRAISRISFDKQCCRCRKAGLEVPEKANDVLGLTSREVPEIMEIIG